MSDFYNGGKLPKAYAEPLKPFLSEERRRYRLIGVMMFIIACALLAVRIFVNLLSYAITDDTALEAIFSITLQIGVLFVFPFLFYTYMLKMKPKEIFSFSGFHKTNKYNYLIAIGIGLLAMFVTTGISALWQFFISVFGYTHSSAGDDLPEKFNALLMLLSFFLTAVLPGFCEEFAVRGGYLKTIRSGFSQKTTLIIMAISFGLFHQNITQVFYTACFGALTAFIVLKTKSIFPAMIIHFLNNGMSVYLQYAEKYGFFGGGYYDAINYGLSEQPFLIFIIYVAICACFVALVALLWHINSSETLAKKRELISNSAFDVTNKRVVLLGEENRELVRELEMEKEVYGGKIDEELLKPDLRDNIFLIGALVVTILSTVFSFVWGLII